MSKFTEWADAWWWRFDGMQPRTAYEVAKCAKNTDLFIDLCKTFILHHERGHEYTFSDDLKFFKRLGMPEPNKDIPYHKMPSLPDGIRVETISEGFTESITINSKVITVTHSRERGKPYVPSYRVYRGDKLIAIET